MNNRVRVLAVLATGELVAAGSFTTASGSAANPIAQWNGTTWQPLGTGLGDTVHALCTLPSGDLFAGGDFTSAGGAAANHVARWNGTA